MKMLIAIKLISSHYYLNKLAIIANRLTFTWKERFCWFKILLDTENNFVELSK